MGHGRAQREKADNFLFFVSAFLTKSYRYLYLVVGSAIIVIILRFREVKAEAKPGNYYSNKKCFNSYMPRRRRVEEPLLPYMYPLYLISHSPKTK